MEEGPSALRSGGLARVVSDLGWEFTDWGDAELGTHLHKGPGLEEGDGSHSFYGLLGVFQRLGVRLLLGFVWFMAVLFIFFQFEWFGCC